MIYLNKLEKTFMSNDTSSKIGRTPFIWVGISIITGVGIYILAAIFMFCFIYRRKAGVSKLVFYAVAMLAVNFGSLYFICTNTLICQQ